MSSKGNYTAFQRLRPTKGLSQDIQRQQNNLLRRRREDRIEENIEYQRDLAKKKADQELVDKYIKPLDNFDSGSKSINEANAKLLMNGQKKMGELLQKLQDSEVGSDQYIEAKLGLESLNKLPEKIKTMYSTRLEQFNKITELAEQGKIHKDEAYQKYVRNYQNQASDLKFGLDDQYSPVVAFLDEDNNVSDTDSYDSVVGGKLAFDATPVIDFEKRSKLVAEEAGQIERTNPVGGGATRYTSNAKKSFINSKAEEYFSIDENGNLTKEAKSAFIQAGIPRNEWTKSRLNNLKNAFIEDTLGRTDESTKTTKTNSRNIGSNDSNEDRVKTKQPVTPTKRTWGEKINLIDAKAKSVGVSNVVLPAIRTKDQNGNERFITDAEVRNYTYTSDGQMIVDVVYQDSKYSTFEEKEKGLFEKLIEQRREAESKKEQAEKNGEEATAENYEEEIKKYNLQLKRLKQGGQNKREAIVIPREDEADVASYFGGINAAKVKAGVLSQTQQKKEDENQGQEVDEYGVPIN